MKRILIHEKLKEFDVNVEDISLGEFDYIGEYTAKKNREESSPLFKKAGMFFRPNYERGILIHYLIKQHNLRNFLEIGFGRGYGSICAARALYENGIREQGAVTTIDPVFNQEHMNMLANIFPQEWLRLINFVRGTSKDMLPKLENKFDLIYVDGNHMAEAVQSDWNMCKDKWNNFLLFDDYHPETDDASIQCAQVIDNIEDPTKELIIQDRRIFVDDRRLADEDIKYGQVLLTNKENTSIRKSQDKATLWNW